VATINLHILGVSLIPHGPQRRLTWGMGCRGSFSLSMAVLSTPATASALQMRSAL
jgi:hypothetical protein